VDIAIAERPSAPAGRREGSEPPGAVAVPAQAAEPPPSKPDSAWPDERYRGWSGL
jgi:hypothetical protein